MEDEYNINGEVRKPGLRVKSINNVLDTGWVDITITMRRDEFSYDPSIRGLIDRYDLIRVINKASGEVSQQERIDTLEHDVIELTNDKERLLGAKNDKDRQIMNQADSLKRLRLAMIPPLKWYDRMFMSNRNIKKYNQLLERVVLG